MKTVIVTDGKYRSSIAAVRALGRAGWQVVVTQTRDDVKAAPPVFFSKYAAETVWIDGRADDDGYTDRLAQVVRAHGLPVLFCVGAVSLNAVSRRRDEFSRICDFLIAPPEVLDALNDKETVHARALELGIPVPKQFDGEPDAYPVVIKPHCGEKFGLKARDRYAVAGDRAEYEAVLAAMRRYDPSPIVQQKISGDGAGASLLLDSNGRLISALCHRRIREYPITGGPSTCCVSFYDETKIAQAYELLRSFGFTGMAMVEFKGDSILEVNPRVWGSFPMTECAGSDFAACYAAAASGETVEYRPGNYNTGVKMRFVLNDTAAVLSYLGHGKFGRGFGGIGDAFGAKEALKSADDPAPFRVYLKNTFQRK